MELTDRYVHAVTSRLPIDMQADVSDELHSTIEDMLDKKGSRTKKAVKEVLTELGDPAILAARYIGKSQYVISPQFYPIFIRFLKLALAIGLPIAALVGAIVQIIEAPGITGGFVGGIVNVLIAAAVQIVFWTALVFFVIERSGVSDKELLKNSGWTPDMLPAVTDKREIPLSDGIADAVWYALVAALPFVAQPLIGAHIDGKVIPFFDPAIWAVCTPVLVTLGIIGVIKSAFKLRLGRWTKPLAIFNTLYAAAFSAVLVAAATAMTLVNPEFVSVVNERVPTTDGQNVTDWATWSVGITVAVFVIVYLYDAGNSLYHAFWPKPGGVA